MDKILAELFKENNWEPIKINGKKVQMSYRIPVSHGQRIKIIFNNFTNEVTQGLAVSVDRKKGKLEINGQKIKYAVFWTDTAPKEFEFSCLTKETEGTVGIWNIWKHPKYQNTEAWMGNAGLVVEKIDENTVILHCSNGLGEINFEDLVIKVTRVS